MQTVFLQIPQIHMLINKCECIAREFMVRDGRVEQARVKNATGKLLIITWKNKKDTRQNI